jgi:hypothetical protein
MTIDLSALSPLLTASRRPFGNGVCTDVWAGLRQSMRVFDWATQSAILVAIGAICGAGMGSEVVVSKGVVVSPGLIGAWSRKLP